MSLAPGARLGPYEVLAPLGAGGMGKVYRARDTKLGRDVALKILPDSFASDPDRLARFEREAQVLASLNHPNIGAIYGLEDTDGLRALVLELVEGETLADRIARGPIPLDEALPLAKQIAGGLEAAHEHGIIHRDLKPANIKLRLDGTVKVLDFGLAKALDPVLVAGDVSQLPTITGPAMTRAGAILGTAAYMSPEQARGQIVDKRTDMWAFGCVLYEMLTGRRAFGGVELSDTLAEVIKSDPDWRALPSGAPISVRRLLRRCLVKDQKARLADPSTARLEIDDALAPAGTGESQTVPAPPRRLLYRAGIAWSVAAVSLLAAVVLGSFAYRRNAIEDAPVFHAIIPAPDNTIIGSTRTLRARSEALQIALSPNGRHLVFVATNTMGLSSLWVRPLDGGSARPLAGTESGNRPFWSPDSRSVAFFADFKLKRVDIAGGPVLTICDMSFPTGGGGTWNAEGVILFASTLVPPNVSPIYRVAASGGTPTSVTSMSGTSLDSRALAPFLLPDGRHFLYTSTPATTMRPSVYVGSIDRPEQTRLLEGVASAQYARGRLLFLRGNTLVAQSFDDRRRVLTGEVAPIAEDIAIDLASRIGLFSVSATGVLAYQSGTIAASSQLTWFNRTGKSSGVLGDPGDYNSVNLSPDGTRSVVSVRDGSGNMDLWLLDVARGVRTRFTFDQVEETVGIWSPDGKEIVFDSAKSGRRDLYRGPVGGSGSGDLIDARVVGKLATSWSADGKHLLYNSLAATPGTGNDVWVVPLFGERKSYLFLQTQFNELRAQFSPDARWIAYQSNESGRNEVYVAPFPGPGGKSQVSTSGGGSPRWRRNGQELFYVALDGRLMSAAVDTRGSTLALGAIRGLFDTRMRDQGIGTPYDVTADGERFLVNAFVEQSAPSSITLIVNWPALLKK